MESQTQAKLREFDGILKNYNSLKNTLFARAVKKIVRRNL